MGRSCRRGGGGKRLRLQLVFHLAGKATRPPPPRLSCACRRGLLWSAASLRAPPLVLAPGARGEEGPALMRGLGWAGGVRVPPSPPPDFCSALEGSRLLV